MSTLLEIRETMKQIYTKYEIYITPVLKFILSLFTLLLINLNLGYMSKLNSLLLVLVISLACSFLPINLIIVISAGFVLGHLYAVSLECAMVAFALFTLLFLLYFRFSPKDTLVILLLPLCFLLRIPYVIPIAVGLVASPASVVSVSFGIVVYYLIAYIKQNATALSSMDADNVVAKVKFIVDGMLNNKEMLVVVIAFSAALVCTYLIKRISMNYSWIIAMSSGTVLNIIFLLTGDLMFDTNISIFGLIFGSFVSIALLMVLQFFVFNVDYSRTEYVQFEDDEYFYYVKAVPKNTVAKTEKTVKKITSVI